MAPAAVGTRRPAPGDFPAVPKNVTQLIAGHCASGTRAADIAHSGLRHFGCRQ
jgi:hypothetical protein